LVDGESQPRQSIGQSNMCGRWFYDLITHHGALSTRKKESCD
jgi:hypothetical protein